MLRNGLSGLFSDGHVTKKHVAALICLKALAIPAFYYTYERHYGGMELYDSGKFYNDAKVLRECALKHPLQFIKLYTGLENGKSVGGDHRACLDKTKNWQKGRSSRFFYNDNRIVIRVHTVLDFFAFGTWFVHGFFSTLMSFIGLFYLYRTFKDYLQGRERLLLTALCLCPALWFYTGALLKEGLLMLVLGGSLWLIRKTVVAGTNKREKLTLLVLLLLSCVLKPYLLLSAEAVFAVTFILERKNVRHRAAMLAGIVITGIIVVSVSFSAIKNTSVPSIISEHRKTFSGMAGGGIFLSGDTTYVQLQYDTSLVRKVPGYNDLYTIVRGASFMYWEDSHNRDTLYRDFNTDTSTVYELAFMTPASRSNFMMPDLNSHPASALLSALYYSFCHPFFFKTRSVFDILASFENLLLVSCAAFTLWGLWRSRRPGLLPAACLLFVIVICLIVTLSAPNTGAVLRYRAPTVIFLLISSVYYLTPKRV